MLVFAPLPSLGLWGNLKCFLYLVSVNYMRLCSFTKFPNRGGIQNSHLRIRILYFFFNYRLASYLTWCVESSLSSASTQKDLQVL